MVRKEDSILSGGARRDGMVSENTFVVNDQWYEMTEICSYSISHYRQGFPTNFLRELERFLNGHIVVETANNQKNVRVFVDVKESDIACAFQSGYIARDKKS